jgi:signal peptidase II
LKVKAWITLLTILGILLIDQGLKFHIKTNYILETGHLLFGSEKFRIHFTENEGMAFGIEFGGRNGKLFLSLFRIVAVSFIGYYLLTLARRNAPMGLLLSIGLVFAGAMGNIIDSVFYGVLFSHSSMHGPVAQFLPAGGGYAPLFYGKVVDMFYFPVWQGHYPPWLFGGRSFTFFQPVFNVADAAITTGVFWVLLFQREHFSEPGSPLRFDRPAAEEGKVAKAGPPAQGGTPAPPSQATEQNPPAPPSQATEQNPPAPPSPTRKENPEA